MAINQMNAKKRVMKRAKGGSLKEDKNPAVSTKMLNEIVGRATGQGYGAARKGGNLV
jgi:hypothetical protein